MLTSMIGKVIRFDTVAPGVLGAARDRVTVMGILDLDTAAIFSDVRAKHTQVRNYHPALPLSAGAYSYVKLKYSNGDVEYLGLPWIRTESIEVIGERTGIVTIPDFTPAVENIVRQALLQNGIEKFDILLQEIGAPV